jgi:HAD superfamily hydrolase (TIGR01458 family)
VIEARGLLLDIDGVLTVSWEAIPGAPEAVAALRGAGVPFALITNTTTETREGMASRLADAGFEVAPGEILTAPLATAAYLRRHHPGARCYLLGLPNVAADLEGVDLVDGDAYDAGTGGDVDLVVVGGADDAFAFHTMNRALRMLLGGADLVAMHRNLSWMEADGMSLDAGAYVMGLEAASGATASVAGKPSPDFFQSGLDLLGLAAGDVAMVGDDVETDVLAAQELGMTGVLVRTGKFRPELLARTDGAPDVVVDSIADVPALLGSHASN